MECFLHLIWVYNSAVCSGGYNTLHLHVHKVGGVSVKMTRYTTFYQGPEESKEKRDYGETEVAAGRNASSGATKVTFEGKTKASPCNTR